LVHQRDKRGAAAERPSLGQGSECKSVDDNRTAGRHRREERERSRTLRATREGKVVAYVSDSHVPTEVPKFLDDAPVIAITSSRRGEIAWYCERKMRFMGWSLTHNPDPLVP
jgi:hypothetical protein